VGMREIKFKVWSKEQKTMGSPTLYFGRPFTFGEVFRALGEDNNYILMQYTGLKDDNDKEMYEGDVLRFWDRDAVIADTDGEIGYVVFNKFNGWVVNKEKYDDEMSYYQILAFCENYEIIGNIYENPELLKGVGAS